MLAMATTIPTTTRTAGEQADHGGEHKLKAPIPRMTTATASSSSKSPGSLVQHHQPFASSPTQTSSNSHVTLPPISSFDNLIRAAEKQYSNNTNTNNSTISTPVNGPSPSFLSYQLSPTDASSSTTVPRSIGQRPSSVGSNSSSSSSSFSPRASLSMTTSSFEHSLSPMLAATQSSHLPSSRTDPLPSSQPYVSKIHKPRKKKQCPICHNFYANLSTHKSTHLTPEDRPHKCPICRRGFARNNDLIRHKKRHWKDEILENSSVENSDADEHVSTHQPLDEHDQLKSLHQIKGTFKCPFNAALIQLDMEIYPYKSKPLNFETSSCHQTGVFSRCDTFKNHLKALHFEYPPGTKKRDRTVVAGRCKHCGVKFPNVDIWLNEHVGKTCGYTYH